MRHVFLLARAFLRAQPARTLSTCLAVLCATAIVVWVVGGYDAILRTYDTYASRALGRYVLSVDPIRKTEDPAVPPEVVDALRGDDRVVDADPMSGAVGTVDLGGGAGGGDTVTQDLLVLGTDAAAPPFDLVDGSWLGGAGDDAPEPEACLSMVWAERLGVEVGRALAIRRGDGTPVTVRIVGRVANPPDPVSGEYVGSLDLPSPSIAAVYVRRDTLARWSAEAAARIAFVGVALRPDVDVHAFRYAWGPRLLEASEPVQFMRDVDLEEALDEASTAQNLALQSYAATALAMVLAFLVIFNTLNMGVSERARTLALLRVVTLTRGQVAALVFGEALLLALIGYLPGLALGAGLLEVLEIRIPRLQRNGAELGAMSLTLSAAAAFGAALAAAVVPAWRATRVRPLDAVAPVRAGSAVGSLPLGLTWTGAAALVAAPVLAFGWSPGSDGPVTVWLLATYGLLAYGLIALCPGLLVLVDRVVAAAPTARVLSVEPRLLSNHLARQLGRNVGVTVALGLGLGLFVAIQTWGFTMLREFVPGPWAPAAMVIYERPRDAEHVAKLTGVEGIGPDDVLPFVLEQPRLLGDPTGSAERASIIRQDNVILAGLDGDRAFGGDRPLLPCRWTRGNAADAAAGLRARRGCVVPEHFLRESGLELGDSIELLPPEAPEHPVRYTIVGAVRLTGWHWQTKTTRMRPRTHRAAALVFADEATVRADFALDGYRHVWLRTDLDSAGLEAAAAAAGAVSTRDGVGEGGSEGSSHDGTDPGGAEVVTVDEVRGSVLGAATGVIWAMSGLPLVVLVIATLGLLNLILASIKARRREFGLFRAVGFAPSTLHRLVVAESLSIGLAACVLSLGGGILAGWCGTAAASAISFFGGMRPELTLPWAAMAGGVVVLLLFSLAAAWLPARSTAREPVLDLLQQVPGR